MQSPDVIAAQIAERISHPPVSRRTIPLEPRSEVSAPQRPEPHGDASNRRRLIAVAGPPASGKSTVSAALLAALNANGPVAGLLAMDGFHLDNGILDARGLRQRKGAPETFDFAGLRATLHRLIDEEEVIVPTFDRTRDVSLGASAVIGTDVETVVVEGNYLLLNETPWVELRPFWDFTVLISAENNTLEQRLVDRWIHHGFSPKEARAKALENDIPNAMRVLNGSFTPDLTINA